MNPTLKIRRIHPNATLPVYAKPGDAGMDLHACEATTIRPGATKRIMLGIAIEIPEGFVGDIRPRSGLASRCIVATYGTIDSGYRGEIGAILTNESAFPFDINPGDRIAQLVIAPVARCRIVEVDALSETERGANGFGSTGVAAPIRGVVVHEDGSYTMPRSEYERVFGRQAPDVGAGSTISPSPMPAHGCDSGCAPRGCGCGGAPSGMRAFSPREMVAHMPRGTWCKHGTFVPEGLSCARCQCAEWEGANPRTEDMVGWDANGAPVGPPLTPDEAAAVARPEGKRITHDELLGMFDLPGWCDACGSAFHSAHECKGGA